MRIDKFISELKATDRYIEQIYSNGSCYRLAVLLKRIYGGQIVINRAKDHAAIMTDDGLVFDINGINDDEEFTMPTADELSMMKSWSFAKHCAISISECESCGEPVKLI